MKTSCSSSRGIALIIVLAYLALIVVVIAVFMMSVTRELEYSNSTSNVGTTRQLADSALNIAMAQITDGTSGVDPASTSSILAWASQPGMIRTYDTGGNPKNFYKLYSSDKMVVSGTTFSATADVPPTTWDSAASAGQYVDMNAPLLQADTNGVITVSGQKYTAFYPIVDPFAEQQTNPTTGIPVSTTSGVDGFYLTSRPGYTGGNVDITGLTASADPTINVSGQTANPAPMPVKWLYVLSTGAVVAPTSVTNGVATIPGAGPNSPIVGRIAFWTDDETAKVNINTASEGVYWDVPRVASPEDFGTTSLSTCQPAQNEFQRYSGHPASTSLSPILRNFSFPIPSPVSIASSAANPGQFNLYYSLSPTIVAGGSKAGSVNPTGALSPGQNRLFATAEELMFSTNASTATPPYRIPNTSTTTTPNLITKNVLEKTGFFLTANSSAPEVTLFNTPRISMWPVWATASLRTAYDNVATICSTIGGNNYFFTRSNARSGTADYTTQNAKLYEYLRALTGQAEPGFGGNFLSKYSTDRDQILTLIYDYIRCINIADSSAGATPYTPLFDASNFGSNPSFPLGAGEVVPIKITPTGGTLTKGAGRILTVSEGDMLFYGTHISSGFGNPVDKMRAAFLLQFASPMEGMPGMRSGLKYTVSGLDAMTVTMPGSSTAQSLNFSTNSNGDNGTNFIDTADIQTYGGRSIGGVEGPFEGFQDFHTGSNTKQLSTTAASATSGFYPFYSFSDVSFTPTFGASSFTFSGGTVTIKIYTQDTNELVQTVKMTFPSGGQFNLPGVYGGSGANPTGTPFNNRLSGAQGSQSGLLQSVDTIVGVQMAGPVQGNAPTLQVTDNTAGDYRIIAPLDTVSTSFYRASYNYLSPGVQLANGLTVSCGAQNIVPQVFGTSTDQGYFVNASYTTSYGWPAVPTRVSSSGVIRKDGGPGSFDTGTGDHPDGAYMNKSDEGDGNTASRVAYMGGGYSSFSPPAVTYFSPNRQVSSPLMFGSVPTGVQRYLPWQTLLFHAAPEDTTNPGLTSPADHLLADLFWMPVVEPYAISQPLATSGKINLNYQIEPFTYIQRKTGLYSVLKSTEFMAIPTSDGSTYKQQNTSNGNRRYSIDIPTTLEEFDYSKFNNNDIFRSTSEICGIDLVPYGQGISGSSLATLQAGMKTFWQGKAMTGNNLRNKPYSDIYSRLTTKSNTFTVHVYVQALKKTPQTPTGVFVDPNGSSGGAADQIVGEYRGSTVIERYIDPNETDLPDFAQLAISNPTNLATANVSPYYKFRVVNTRVFAPMKMSVHRRGFTLIELLVVLAIIVVVATMSGPSIFSALRGTRLAQGDQAIEGVLALARRTAITTNRAVEVRFYRYAGKGAFASNNSYRSVQVFEMTSSSTYVAVEKVQLLPDGIILDSNATLSSLLDQTKRTSVTGTTPLPGIGTSYAYMYVRFYPDGSTDLLSTNAPWFATLHDETKGDNLTTPPTNFITIQIDSVSGTLTYYRP